MDAEPRISNESEEVLKKLFMQSLDSHETFSDDMMKKIQQNLLDLEKQVREANKTDGE